MFSQSSYNATDNFIELILEKVILEKVSSSCLTLFSFTMCLHFLGKVARRS